MTSTTGPPPTDTLTSCLIVPIPRATLPLARSSLPSETAIILVLPGLALVGSSAISTSGTPSRSRQYSRAPSSRLAASSSRHIDWTPTGPPPPSPPTDRLPPCATRIVRWNPDVLDPSMTILRMGNSSRNTREPRAAATISDVRSASPSRSCGGSSSSSTRQLVPAAPLLYVIVAALPLSKTAAGSYLPVSLFDARRALAKPPPCPPLSPPPPLPPPLPAPPCLHPQNSLRPVASCWCISRPTTRPILS